MCHAGIFPRGGELCARCAAGGRSCCKTDPEAAHLIFPLSEAEWRRLLPHAALAGGGGSAGAADLYPASPLSAIRPPRGGDAICAEEDNTPGFMAAMRRLFTLDRDLVRKLFPPGGGHFRLRLGPDGSCVFLGEDGCRLPRQVRPWYCLLFPAWIQGRTATLFQPETCLIARRAGSPAQGLAILGLTPDEARALYEALRRDWGLPSGATPL